MPIAVTVGFGTAFGQTLANGGSFGQAFAAGAMGGLIGGVGAWGLGIAGGYVAAKNPMLSYALAVAGLGGGTYQTVESFRSGQYVAGGVGAVFVAFGVATLLASARGGNGAVEDPFVARRAPSGKEGPVDGFVAENLFSIWLRGVALPRFNLISSATACQCCRMHKQDSVRRAERYA